MSIYDFWFSNENLWFNSSISDDQIIINKFYYLLNLNTKTESKKHLIECIIIYDQLVRHFFRGKKLPKIYSDIAINCSKKIINSNIINDCLPQELCFVLLPYRHLKTIHHIEFCLDIVSIYIKYDLKNKYYQRFYKASLKSLSEIKSKSQLMKPFNYCKTFDTNILDSNCTFKLYEPITVNKLNEKLVNGFRNLPKQTFTLSISGGVDSIVCSYILYCLKIPFVGLIIDYSNRESSIEEINMVSYWFNLLKISLYVRTIDEIKRNKSDRQFYEKITKNIRFDCYKILNNPVILGHNRDDKIENIFANINKCQNYDNLNGMKDISRIDGVEIYRCLLDINKSDIIKFAQKMKLPYVYDSTPDWSFRGKTRDKIIPAIKSVDKNILNGLEMLSENLKDVMKLIDFDKIISNIRFTLDEINVKKLSFPRQNTKLFIFWQKLFKFVNEKYGFQIFSKKSIINFISQLSQKETKVLLCKNCKGIIKNGVIILTEV